MTSPASSSVNVHSKKVKTGFKIRRTNELISQGEGILSESIEIPIKVSKVKKQSNISFMPDIDDLDDGSFKPLTNQKNKSCEKMNKAANLAMLKAKIEGRKINFTNGKTSKKAKLCGSKNKRKPTTELRTNGWIVRQLSESSEDEVKENVNPLPLHNRFSLGENIETFTPIKASSPGVIITNADLQENKNAMSSSTKLEDRKRNSSSSGSISTKSTRMSPLTKSMSSDLDDTYRKNSTLMVGLSSSNSESNLLSPADLLKINSTIQLPNGAASSLNLTYTESANETYRKLEAEPPLNDKIGVNVTYEKPKSSLTPTTEPVYRKRSTLTLEDSVNNVELLKSACDLEGTPQKVIKPNKSRYSVGDLLRTQLLSHKMRRKSFNENVLMKLSDSGKIRRSSQKIKENRQSFAKTLKEALQKSYISISSETEDYSSDSSNEVEATLSNLPKSALKSKNNTDSKSRKVTFHEESCIVIDDSDNSYSSPVRATDFIADNSIYEVTSTTSTDTGSTIVQRPRISSDLSNYHSPARRSRISSDSLLLTKSNSKQRNSSLYSSFHNRPCSSTTKNTNCSSNQKLPNPASIPKRTIMPNFAQMHQKLFNNMLDIKEYSEKKALRAQKLLSSQKSGVSNRNQTPIPAKKKLEYVTKICNASSSKSSKTGSTPKSAKNEKMGLTRFGFKIAEKKEIVSKEQKIVIANKMRPLTNTTVANRIQIKGVRSNRRFELLMKMRSKQ